MTVRQFTTAAQAAGFSEAQAELLLETFAQQGHHHDIDEVDGLEDALEDADDDEDEDEEEDEE